MLPTSRVPFQLSTNWNTVNSLFFSKSLNSRPFKRMTLFDISSCRTIVLRKKNSLTNRTVNKKNFRRATVLQLGHNVIQNIWLLRWFGTPCNIYNDEKETTISNNQGFKIFKNCYIFTQITFIKVKVLTHDPEIASLIL